MRSLRKEAKLIRWTSPVLTLTVGGIDLSSADVRLTIEQGDTLVTKTCAATYDGKKSTVTAEFTQAETAAFEVGIAYAQINYVMAGNRGATKAKAISILANLFEGEL